MELLSFLAWLWTAPEHLRDSKLAMTQKGDVYSFGIILQEVYTESDPFGTVNLSAAGSSIVSTWLANIGVILSLIGNSL